MKKLVIVVAFAILDLALSLHAATETAEVQAKKSQASATSHSFEDLLVQGKYHFSDEAVTTVEEDKVLDSLIGVRSDFKDRLKKSTARR
jgi:hypothetical protein